MFQDENDVLRKTNETFIISLGITYFVIFVTYIIEYFKGSKYLMMVLLVVGNVPLLYLLNRDWFNTLIYTTPGKAVTGICGAVILVTFILMKKYTKPVKVRD